MSEKTNRESPSRRVLEMKDAVADRDLDSIVRRYSPLVMGACLKVTGNRHDAEDAAQAVFLCLAMQLRQGQPIKAMAPWLYQVAHRASIDLCRRRARRRNHEGAYAQRHDPSMLAADGGEDPASKSLAVIQKALTELPVKYRMPLILHYFGGLSHAELSKQLGCSANTLRVRMCRGHKMLRECLGARGVELAGASLGVMLAEVVRRQVSESLLSEMAVAGTVARRAGLMACGAPADVMATASTMAVPSVIRIKLAVWIALGMAAMAGASVAGPVWSTICNRAKDWDGLREIWDLAPRIEPRFDLSLPSLTSSAGEVGGPKLPEVPVAARPIAATVAGRAGTERPGRQFDGDWPETFGMAGSGEAKGGGHPLAETGERWMFGCR